MEVAAGCVVTVEYTVRLADGALVDSTGGCGPLAVLHGAGQLFPALEDRIVGMRAGETREIRIPPEEAYGAWRPELVRMLPRDRLPPDLDLVVGGEYGIAAPDGKRIRFRVLDVTADEVRADFNRRTAGQELLATVTVVDVRPATAEEERRGRV
ncbi:MAG TPA: peptidylprolyl isomerase [Candidatus Binatia bacterium]|nr:peptidylprolyl isomerase [Candidatus Binatia bacterium]